MALYVPDATAVKADYLNNIANNTKNAFPYWTKVWPSAIALSEYIDLHIEYVKGKRVLEIAGGLGLPSLVAAQYAAEVCCSDYLSDIGNYIDASAKQHHLKNVSFQVINWHELPKNLNVDLILLSDVNYEPDSFISILNMIFYFLNLGKQIILTTPQRLMAKAFIEQLLPYTIINQTSVVNTSEGSIAIQLLVLKQGG